MAWNHRLSDVLDFDGQAELQNMQKLDADGMEPSTSRCA